MNRDPENTNASSATGSNLTPTHGVWLVILSAAAGLVVLGVIFRTGPVRD